MERPSWHSYFLQIAKLTSERSNCIRRKVGAVVVKDNRILGLGENGTPRNTLNCFEGGCSRCNDSKKEAGQSLEICMCLHAEENAILFVGAQELKDSTLEITLCPCLSCCKKILQCQIREVYFIENESDQDRFNIEYLQKEGILVSGPHSEFQCLLEQMQGGTALWRTIRSFSKREPCTECERIIETEFGERSLIPGATINVVFFSGLGWSIQTTMEYIHKIQNVLQDIDEFVNFETMDHMQALNLQDAVDDACRIVRTIDGPEAMMGESIGSGIATLTAACMNKTRPPDELVLFAAFKNLSNWLNVPGFKGATKEAIGNVLDSKRAIPNISAPIAIAAGSKDTTILYKFSEKLAQIPNQKGQKSVLYEFPDFNHASILKTVTSFVAEYAFSNEFPPADYFKYPVIVH